MNEFIVWDEASKKFIGYEDINEFARPRLYDGNVFPYIGKKDINNQEIYADCSIVEFDVVINGYRQTSHTISLKGSFEFNDDDLRYEINIYNDPEFVCLWYDSVNMSNFKIIDTIQENKRGLIK